MRAIVGPLCSCLSYNKYHKENLTENLNRIKVLSLEYKCKEIGNLLSQICLQRVSEVISTSSKQFISCKPNISQQALAQMHPKMKMNKRRMKKTLQHP